MSEFSYAASDYAGLTAGPYSFYYGYEELLDGVWAFVACKDGKEIYRKAIEPDSIGWDCSRGLLEGIGNLFSSGTV